MGTYFGSCDHRMNKLREAEIRINQGISISEASREIGVTQQTYYRWRKEYGSLRIKQLITDEAIAKDIRHKLEALRQVLSSSPRLWVRRLIEEE